MSCFHEKFTFTLLGHVFMNKRHVLVFPSCLAGLVKTRGLKKNQPSVFFVGFLGFLVFFRFFYIFAQKREFLVFFQFQEYFYVHPDVKLYR
jgi:hypothetical protein